MKIVVTVDGTVVSAPNSTSAILAENPEFLLVPRRIMLVSLLGSTEYFFPI